MDEFEYDEQDLSGLTISYSPDGDSFDADDPAAAWLAAAEGRDFKFDEEDGSPVSKDYLEGAMTDADLQLGRIQHLEPRIQAGIKSVLLGGMEGINPIDAAAAREVFGDITGVSSKVFANRIKVDSAVQTPRHFQDIKTVLSVMQNTSGEYLERGPGKVLPGNLFDSEKQAAADMELKEAFGYVKEISDLYIHQNTRGTKVEGARRLALEEAITKRLIDGVFYDGSKDLLPLPNETGVFGIVRTQGVYSSYQGTAEDRLSSGKFADAYETYLDGVKTKYVRDDKGHRVFKESVSQEDRLAILRETPSLANSLFPMPKPERGQKFTREEHAAHARLQKHNMAQLQTKAEIARRVLRKELPTNFDESADRIRMVGFNRPVGDQDEMLNLIDEAARQDITWHDVHANQGDVRSPETLLSDYVYSRTKGGKDEFGEAIVKKDLPHAQGTEEWLAQRKGKITASKVGRLLGKSGIENLALELATERLGTAKPFAGNADTREGSEGEKLVARAFLASHGKGLRMEEAFFESDEDLPNFGVSPDGRLYDEEGNSAGLLELKYLSSGSMEGALKKYTPQLQLQMAVTKEEQAHFYALDKHTGDYVYELVKADPEMQARLIEAGNEAHALASGLNNLGVQDLRNRISSSGKVSPKAAEDVSGQKKSFEPSRPLGDEVARPFRPSSYTKEPERSALGTVLMAERVAEFERLDAAEELASLGNVDLGNPRNGDSSTNSNAGSVSPSKVGRFDSPYAKDGGKRGSMFESRLGGVDVSSETTAASKEAAEAIKSLAESARQAGGILSNIGNVVLAGNESGLSEARLASETGLDITQVRGVRKSLEMGGLSNSGIDRVVSSGGRLAKSFNDEAVAAKEITRIMSSIGQSNLEGVRNLDIGDIQELKGKDAQQLISMVSGLMEGKSIEERAQIGDIFGVPELATSYRPASELLNVDASIDRDGLVSTNTGIQTVKQTVRDVTESLGSLGTGVGVAAASLGVAGLVAKSAVGSLIGSGLSKGASAIKGAKASGMINSASAAAKNSARAATISAANGLRGASMLQGLSTAAKATPMAIALTAAPMAVRAIGDIQDDGSVGDSAMDVLEFAAYGAAIGSVVPGVGTLAGGAVGAVAGLANEAWEYFSSDDVLPSKNIGNIEFAQEATGTNNNIVNVEVKNEIAKDLIRTTTNVDGDLSIDEETI